MIEENKKGLVIALVASLIVLFVLIILVFISANKKTYIVSINDGNNVIKVEVLKNSKLLELGDLKKEGYVFKGWYKDGTLYDFDSKVTEEFVLEAKFVEEEKDNKEETKSSLTTTTTTSPVTTTKPTANTTTKQPVKTTTEQIVTTTTKTPTTTNAPTTTTAKPVTYSVSRVDVANSTIGQEMIYIINNSTGQKVAGTVVITYVSGNSETVSVPATGKMVVKSTISSVTSPKGY